jgi:hypothetical protein
VIRRLRHLDNSANVGDGLALGDQLIGGPLLLFEKASPAQKPFGLELANELLRCMPGAFHGLVPGLDLPTEDFHSTWTGFRGPRHLVQRA